VSEPRDPDAIAHGELARGLVPDSHHFTHDLMTGRDVRMVHGQVAFDHV
jgi:hypothetical protein